MICNVLLVSSIQQSESATHTHTHTHTHTYGASQVVLVLKNPPVYAGDIRGAGSVPLKEGMGTNPRILVWRIPWMEEYGRL